MLINIHRQLEQKNPKIKPIKNKGWVHYELMKSFVPIKSHGRVTFSANIQRSITDTLPSTTSSGAVTPSPGCYAECNEEEQSQIYPQENCLLCSVQGLRSKGGLRVKSE
jgi:hypothetical protein